MARPRRAVIRAAVAANRPAKPRLSVSQSRPARANTGVSRGRPARPSAGQNGGGRPNPLIGARSGSQATAGGSTAMPWDSQATMEEAGSYRNASDKLAGLRGNWDAEQRSIGIGQGYENNPYSQASLLQRQREIGNRGTINRAGNQLYAGSTVNRLGGVERGYQEGRSQLQERYEARRAQVEREEQATQNEIQTEREQAQIEAIRRAEEQAPAPAPVSGSGGKAWRGTAPKGKGAGTIAPWKKGKGKK